MVRIEPNGQWLPAYHKDWCNGELQELLGGYVQVLVAQPLPGLVVYCNEDGKLKKLEVNRAVNEKLWVLFNSPSKLPSIVGPVVISRTGENGHECGLLPSDLLEITKCFGPCEVGFFGRFEPRAVDA